LRALRGERICSPPRQFLAPLVMVLDWLGRWIVKREIGPACR
jgi:hypothetical protein